MTSRLLTSYAQSAGAGAGAGGGAGAEAKTAPKGVASLAPLPGSGAAPKPSALLSSSSSSSSSSSMSSSTASSSSSSAGLSSGSSSASSAGKAAASTNKHKPGENGTGNGGGNGGGGGPDGKSVVPSGSIPRDPTLFKTKTNQFGDTIVIVDVWAKNLKDELDKIMDIVDDYNFIAMDTEFPGVVARPLGCFKNAHDFHYQTLKCNVDLLKIIQLGLTFCNENGRFLPGTCSWQFNFKFNLSEDMYAQDSIDMLTKSGIDFKEHDAKGIDVEEFGELIMQSGIVLNEDVRWLSFHSGYDYGYLLKLLTCQPLPKDESDFFDLLRLYFPVVYDVKYLMKSCENLKGGLQKVAEDLQVERIGPQHQAGSDSLLTAATFFKIRSLFFENQIDDAKYAGVLYGLGQQLRSKNKTAENVDAA